jgi:hypothetical protein
MALLGRLLRMDNVVLARVLAEKPRIYDRAFYAEGSLPLPTPGAKDAAE